MVYRLQKREWWETPRKLECLFDIFMGMSAPALIVILNRRKLLLHRGRTGSKCKCWHAPRKIRCLVRINWHSIWDPSSPTPRGIAPSLHSLKILSSETLLIQLPYAGTRKHAYYICVAPAATATRRRTTSLFNYRMRVYVNTHIISALPLLRLLRGDERLDTLDFGFGLLNDFGGHPTFIGPWVDSFLNRRISREDSDKPFDDVIFVSDLKRNSF